MLRIDWDDWGMLNENLYACKIYSQDNKTNKKMNKKSVEQKIDEHHRRHR